MSGSNIKYMKIIQLGNLILTVRTTTKLW